jgi:predicted nucleotidyltransferase
MRFNSSLAGLVNTEAKIKVLKYFSQHETPISEREIASIIKEPYTSVNRALKELSSYNIIRFVTVGRAHLWKLNKKSYGFNAILDVIKNRSLLCTPLNDLKAIIIEGIPAKIVQKAVLFGSVSHGDEEYDSDIDLFLLVKNDQDKKTLEPYLETLSTKCLDLYGNSLSAYILTERGLNEKKNSNILQEIENGIQLLP